MSNLNYKVCKRCVMDTSDPFITFDENGFCHHCNNAIKRIQEYHRNLNNPAILKTIVGKINNAGKGRKYNCVVGISGGLDSSFLLYEVVRLGLKPLAVHIDNGWDSDLAVRNIENLLKGLNVDLYTMVLDWEEFKELQKAFIISSVVDFEMLSDNAIILGLYRTMRKFNISYSVVGYNISSESIMPNSWLFQPKFDGLNIRDIYKKNGNGEKIKSFPNANFLEFISVYRAFKKGINIPLLNYISYNKENALEILKNSFGYKCYQHKHYESRITTFYQAYILPVKFNIDKRKAHLSSLICSGQITRDEALLQLQSTLYPEERLAEEKEFFLKKLGFSETEFELIMKQSRVEHLSYRSYYKTIKYLSEIKRHFLITTHNAFFQ